MPKETKMVRINPDDGEWKFIEKNQNGTCTAKNTRTKEEISGTIKSISSNGYYTLEVMATKSE